MDTYLGNSAPGNGPVPGQSCPTRHHLGWEGKGGECRFPSPLTATKAPPLQRIYETSGEQEKKETKILVRADLRETKGEKGAEVNLFSVNEDRLGPFNLLPSQGAPYREGEEKS